MQVLLLFDGVLVEFSERLLVKEVRIDGMVCMVRIC